MLYTGYYAKEKSYAEKGLHSIAISGSVPGYYKGERWKDIAPRFGVFQEWKRGEIDDIQYTEMYKEWLSSLDKEAIREAINEELKEHGNIVFLCYEKPDSFCHRHIFADWLEENLGFKVEEV